MTREGATHAEAMSTLVDAQRAVIELLEKGAPTLDKRERWECLRAADHLQEVVRSVAFAQRLRELRH